MYQESILGCLGSRALVLLDLQAGGFWAVPLGTLFQRQVLVKPFVELHRDDGVTRTLYPVGHHWRRDADTPRKVSQGVLERTMNRVRLVVEFLAEGLICEIDLWHGFYPQDVTAATLPAFYCDLRVTKQTNSNWVTPGGAIVRYGLEVVADAAQAQAAGATLTLDFVSRIDRGHHILAGWTHRARNLADDAFACSTCLATETTFESAAAATWVAAHEQRFEEGHTASFPCIVGMHTPDRLMTWKGTPQAFRYQQQFDSAAAVVRHARDQRSHYDQRVGFFEALFEDSGLDKDALELMALAWQSYLMNTWWLCDPDGQERYLVWEGCCGFLSTVDVEYNIAPLYLQFWPDLLRLQLLQWRDFVADGVLAHDVGLMLTGGKMEYPHPMPVEENSNYLLMLLAYWRYTGDAETLRACFATASTLSAYIGAADTDEDGFIEAGTANTIDDGDVSVQYAPKQVYLAVKAAAAQHAFAELARDFAGLDPAAVEAAQPILERAQAHYQRGYQAVTRAFDGRHLPVCVPGAEKVAFQQIENFQPSQRRHQGPIAGSEGCSIYAANGVLLLKMSGVEPDLPPDMLRADLEYARRRTRTPYGHSHSSCDRHRIWISQNMWSDMVAGYLGADPRQHLARYAKMQNDVNSTTFGGQFTDTWSFAELCYYPRGIACIGVLLSLAGVRADRAAGRVDFRPPVAPQRTPLLFAADWEQQRIAWLAATLADGNLHVELTGATDTLGAWNLTLFDQPWKP